MLVVFPEITGSYECSGATKLDNRSRLQSKPSNRMSKDINRSNLCFRLQSDTVALSDILYRSTAAPPGSKTSLNAMQWRTTCRQAHQHFASTTIAWKPCTAAVLKKHLLCQYPSSIGSQLHRYSMEKGFESPYSSPTLTVRQRSSKRPPHS